ncbi:hypothetical protein MLD38_030288 [Melastoma candidum]|uniref:Uncharacterized protein n=1 Tax=Melastoma candidum TaxID=119954 RepID=A0ACB9MMF9_9MYRT|nr:hypothetical protein MLD38_030288 [Melastoma candidum]
MSAHMEEQLSAAMKRTTDWIFSQEIPSDITVHAGGSSFALHKFPLVSKCGYIRKLVSESSEADLSDVELPDVPGGPEGFELAAKFCYGINFEIGMENIAVLRCVAEYLEMTEDYTVGNLVGRAEAYLNEVALKTLNGAIAVLHAAEDLTPISEKVKLIGRCIDAIASAACRDSEFSRIRRDEDGNGAVMPSGGSHLKMTVEWWAEDLTVLGIDMFQRVIITMLARGSNQYAIGPILMLYAQKSLRGLDIFGKGGKKIEPQQEYEKRVVLETIVSLLPQERNAMSVSFLSTLLRAATFLETTVACRLDLEKRMGMQLGQAVLDDLLIPSYAFTGDTIFDIDTVQRILTNYVEYEMEGKRSGLDFDGDYASPLLSDMERVGKLMENYLAEIASDRNLSVARFINLAELVPEQSRVTEDGMYRAIDIYLKAHPALSDMESKKVCSLMDCQKLSREACAHAAQNDRLPVQTVVQVLYYEQQRMRASMNGGDRENHPMTPRSNPYSMDVRPGMDDVSSLRMENEDLKIELMRMKMRLREAERSAASSPVRGSPTFANRPQTFAEKPPLPRTSFMKSMSKKLGKFYPFGGVMPANPKGKTKPAKDRRHSVS